MRVYVTKYALTMGVFIADGECSTQFPDMFSPSRKPGQFPIHFHKPDWHETWEDALAQAEKMRLRKLAALDKRRKKLEGLKFVKPALGDET